MSGFGLKEALMGIALTVIPAKPAARQPFDRAQVAARCSDEAEKTAQAIENALMDGMSFRTVLAGFPMRIRRTVTDDCMTREAKGYCDRESAAAWDSIDSGTLASDPQLEQATGSAAAAIHAKCMAEISE